MADEMINLLQVVGLLENWYTQDVGQGRQVIWGNILHDDKDRFHDGEFIHTSSFVKPAAALSSGMFINTRNSKYLLGRRRDNDKG